MQRSRGFVHLLLPLVFIAALALFFVLKFNVIKSTQIKLPSLQGRFAYVTKQGELKIRDYISQIEVVLTTNISQDSKIDWSPQGKYIVLTSKNKNQVFDVATKREIKDSPCLMDTSSKKWVGKSDMYSSESGNTIRICDFSNNSSKAIDLNVKGKLLDWFVINDKYAIYIDSQENVGSVINILSVNSGLTHTLVTEKAGIFPTNGKYLWFAEDRNLAYLTPGFAKRVILDENFNLAYQSRIRIQGNYSFIGWNQGQCISGGQVFVPVNNAYLLKKDGNKTSFFEIGFEVPQKYAPLTVTHEIKPGETYWELAERIFGDGTRWREIYDQNNTHEPTQITSSLTINVYSQFIRQLNNVESFTTSDGTSYLDTTAGDGFFFVHNNIFNKPTDVLEAKLLKNSPNMRVNYGAKYTLQNDLLLASVQNGNQLQIFQGDNKIDEVSDVTSSEWDLSNGFCWNNKRGEAAPSQKDNVEGERCYYDYEFLGIMLENFCESNWDHTKTDNSEILKNKTTGMMLTISQTDGNLPKADFKGKIPSGFPYTRIKLQDNLYQYNYQVFGLDGKVIRGIKILCSNTTQEECDVITSKFSFSY